MKLYDMDKLNVVTQTDVFLYRQIGTIFESIVCSFHEDRNLNGVLYMDFKVDTFFSLFILVNSFVLFYLPYQKYTIWLRILSDKIS